MTKDSISKESITSLSKASVNIPKIAGLRTGVEGLDNLFFTQEIENENIKIVPLGGYPSYSVIDITGIPDTGKTLLVEQFAIIQASYGNPVCFVTLEQPAPFLALSLKNRSKALNINFNNIENNIYIIDGSSKSEIVDDFLTFLNTLEFTIKEYNIKITIIDSLTGFFEERETSARSIVRKLFNFMKAHNQTALFVSQKRSAHEALTAETAGGYVVPHVLDGSIVLSKTTITTRTQERLYAKPIGEVLRLFRIDGIRLSGADTRTHVMEITETGLVKVGLSLEKYFKKTNRKENND